MNYYNKDLPLFLLLCLCLPCLALSHQEALIPELFASIKTRSDFAPSGGNRNCKYHEHVAHQEEEELHSLLEECFLLFYQFLAFAKSRDVGLLPEIER